MIKSWKDTLRLLDANGRRQYGLLAILSVVSSVIQALGVSSIPVFFTVLIDGRLPRTVPLAVQSLSIPALGACVFCLVIAGSLSSALAAYYGIKISWQQYPLIASRLLEQYLDNRYEWHIQQNSSELSKMVLVETKHVVMDILQQFVMLVVRGAEVALISLVLLSIRPLVALTAGGSFLGVYFLLYQLNRKFIRQQGEILLSSNSERHRTVSEVLSGVKTIKSFECESFFVSLFKASATAYSRAMTNVQYYAVLPKYFIEVILFGGLVGFVVVAEYRGWSATESIPLITLYGAAAVRMLPGIQQCYFSATSITSSLATLEAVIAGLESHPTERGERFAQDHVEEVLRLENVSYTYPGSGAPSLKHVNFCVSKGEKVGIVGVTGAGKTTLVDILLGLLPPSEGKVVIRDSGPRYYVGYVPQTVSFIDGTVAANIALGESYISPEKMQAAAKMARIHDHIQGLPGGYNSEMGEQGVRLSGGQRQRIGIARALYRGPELLILDEASSALDSQTEQEVFESLFKEDLTLIVIAHRVAVLKACDKIVLLEKGAIVGCGTYNELLASEPLFAGLANSQSDWSQGSEQQGANK